MEKETKLLAEKRWRTYTALVLVLGAVWISLTAVLVPIDIQGSSAIPRPGFKAPDLELVTIAGEPIQLSDLAGKAVVINFWASWCAPCQAEMPALQSVFDRFGGQDLVILAVNSTFQDDPASAADFVSKKGLTFPVLLDPAGSATRLYQVRALPTTFFIDRKGLIRDVAVGGPLNETYLTAQIQTLLSEGR